jgi:transporter family-2 protein
MGDSLEAALVSFGTGLIFVSLISLDRKDVREGFADIFKAVKSKQLPMWRLSAGMLSASFVAMQTHVVPIAGVALFTVAGSFTQRQSCILESITAKNYKWAGAYFN